MSDNKDANSHIFFGEVLIATFQLTSQAIESLRFFSQNHLNQNFQAFDEYSYKHEGLKKLHTALWGKIILKNLISLKEKKNSRNKLNLEEHLYVGFILTLWGKLIYLIKEDSSPYWIVLTSLFSTKKIIKNHYIKYLHASLQVSWTGSSLEEEIEKWNSRLPGSHEVYDLK